MAKGVAHLKINIYWLCFFFQELSGTYGVIALFGEEFNFLSSLYILDTNP